MQQCYDCGAALTFLDRLTPIFSGQWQSNRCRACIHVVNEWLQWAEEEFHSISSQDGRLNREGWLNLTQTAAQRIKRAEIQEHLRRDAIMLLEKAVVQAEERELLSDEWANVIFIQKELAIPDKDISWLLPRITRLSRLTQVQWGPLQRLPKPQGLHLQSGENPYLDEPAAYSSSPEKESHPGHLILTTRMIYFIPDQIGGQKVDILWKNILQVEVDRGAGMIIIRTIRGRKGEGYYRVEDPPLVKSYIDRIAEIVKNVTPTDKASRYIPEHIKTTVKLRDGYKCARCGISGPDAYLEFDHVIPFSKGGPNTAENIQILCRRHNLQKGYQM